MPTVALLVLSLLAADAAEPAAPAIDLAEEADLQFQLGVEAYKRREWLVALEHLLTSNRLVPNKNVVFNIARTYEQLGRFNEAFRHYGDYLAVEPDPGRRGPAEAAIERIRAKVALVRIETDPPGATVYIDRRDLGPRGTTPRTLALEPGEHRVIIERDGYESVETVPINLEVGKEHRVGLSLVPILGTVLVDGTPPGAEIRIDEESAPVIGTVPATLQLPPGPHMLIVSAPGHQTARQLAKVAARETTRAVVDLPLVTGTLVVNAIERDALIEIDGEAAGFTPAVIQVPVGPHHVRVTLTGYRPYETDVTIAEDRGTTLDLRLHPLQEITAASRTAESIEDAPASVSVITSQEIQAFGYVTLYDALAATRGVYQSNDLTYEAVGFRGFQRSGDYGNRVLVTMDGHTVNDDLLGASYVGHDLMVDLDDVERIEVVRGPGSALYGTNAIFGVVNLVMRDGDTMQRPHVEIGTSGQRSARLSTGVSGGNGDRGAWVSAGGIVAQGYDYYFPEYRNDQFGRELSDGWSRDADGFRSGGGTLKAWAGDFTVHGYFNTRDKRIPTGSFGTVLADPRAHSEDTRGFVEGRWEPELSERVQIYARAYVDHYAFDGAYPYAADDVYYDTWRGTWVGPDVRVVATPVDALRLTAGAEASTHLSTRLEGVEIYAGERYPYLDEAPNLSVWSVYAVADARAGARLSASLGARLDTFSTFGSSINPRAAVIVKPTDRDVIKLLAGRAFRAPSVYELTYSDGGTTQVPAPNLQPETIYTGELEATHRFSDVTSVVGSVYYDRIDDLVELDVNGDGLLQYRNATAIVHTAGAELEARREWRRGFMLSVAQSFQRTRTGDLLAGAELTNSPAWLGALKAAMPLVPGAITGATRLRFESTRLIDPGTGERTASVPLWDLIVSGEVPNARLSWSAGARNALDAEYGHPAGDDLLQATVPQPGRELYAEVKVSF